MQAAPGPIPIYDGVPPEPPSVPMNASGMESVVNGQGPVSQVNPTAPHAPSQPGQDNLNAIQRAIDSMEEKGLQEDPRYLQLLALRARQGNMIEKQTGGAPWMQQLR